MTSDADTVIQTAGLTKRFGGVDAVNGIDFQVRHGDVYGFLGPNGSGKTTTIRLLLGLISPTRGGCAIFGEPVLPGAAALRRVGALVERPAFYPYLSAVDNLLLYAAARGIDRARATRLVGPALERVGLGEAARRKLAGYSTGMRQRLGIGTALLDGPELIVLDEPTNGLDPGGVVEVRQLIASLAREGATIFLSSHVLTEVEQLCDRVAILVRGRIVSEGSTRDMLREGERLFLRFETGDEAGRAATLLNQRDIAFERLDDAPALLVSAPASEGARVNRLLGGAGLYPGELSVRRPSLESVFLELTGERDVEPTASAPDAPAAPATVT